MPVGISTGGGFVRADPWDALEQLIAAMLLTSRRHWQHAAWFGCYELASARTADEVDLRTALNRALRELGVDWAQVHRVTVRATDTPGDRDFEIVLAAMDDSASRTITAANYR